MNSTIGSAINNLLTEAREELTRWTSITASLEAAQAQLTPALAFKKGAIETPTPTTQVGRVRQMLQDGPITIDEVASILGINRNNARTILSANGRLAGPGIYKAR